MSVRFPLAAAAVLTYLTSAAAQQPALDAETRAPTLWRVVVHTKPHPLLTPNFRAQLQRDLLAALEPGLAQLGTVDVIDLADVPADKWDPMWEQFVSSGFQALAAPRDLTGVKTHCLRVEYRDGAYHLESRQHDGFTGLASPLVRKQSVRAAELVGRTAGLMLDRDFGLVGTADPAPGQPETKVRIRGGELGPIDRFVKVGDVFVVASIRATTRPAPPPARTATGKIIAPPPGSTPPPALTAALRERTLLKVIEVGKDGTCRCAVLVSDGTGLKPGAGVAAFRCMKVATIQGPVTVRLVSPDGKSQQSSAVSVLATDTGFDGKTMPRDALEFRDGAFRSSKALSNVACVVVSSGATKTFKFPVPVLDAEPVTLSVNLGAQDEERAVFERAVLAASARAADARTAQNICFTALNKLITDGKKNGEALARARAGYRAADDADKGLTEEIAQLQLEAGKSPDAKPLLGLVAQQVRSLRELNAKLAATIGQLEGVVARENDPSVAAAQQFADSLVTKIGVYLATGEVEDALNAYEQLINLRANDPEPKRRRDALKAEWATKDAEHAKARDYLLKAWPALADVKDLHDSLGTLRNAVETCKKADDKHAFRKFLGTLDEFPTKLTPLVAALDPNSDSDRVKITQANEVRTQVGKITQDLTDYLTPKK